MAQPDTLRNRQPRQIEMEKEKLGTFANKVDPYTHDKKSCGSDREAYEGVRESQSSYRKLLERMPVSAFEIDSDGKILYSNSAFAAATGHTVDELCGLNLWTNFFNEEEAVRVRTRFISNEVTGCALHLKTKNGGCLALLLTTANRRNPEGQLEQIVCVGLDATERERTQEALRRSDERFRALIENANDLVAILDADGSMRYLSPALHRVLGYRPEEWEGQNAFQYIHPEDVPEVVAALQKGIVHEDTGLPMCFRMLHKDGSWRIIEATDTNLLENEAVRGIVINARDMTDRKRLEDQLLQSQKMEAIGRLAGGIAHDFNNLLTAINGLSQLALTRLDSSEPVYRDVDGIREAGTRAAALTRQLLAFSRRQILEPRIIDLNLVVSDISRMIRRVIGEDGELVTHLKDDLGYVKADLSQIEQVILNLAVNSRDAMPRGGRLTIETSNEEVRNAAGMEPGRYVLLRIGDTGCGMDPETLARIFEPFFTTKSEGKGTGLGLSTVYGIVKQSGGHITAESQPGQGSVFSTYLPIAETRGDLFTHAEEANQLPVGTETILLVEDEPLVRSLATTLLQRQGYTVLAAGDGVEAIQIAREYPHQIDLLLTDIIMPRMHGDEVAVHVKEHRPGIKVIYASGYTGDAISDHTALQQSQAFIQKPFTLATFARKVREVLDGD